MTIVWVLQGVLHTVSGYMLYTATTFKLVFDHQPQDVYWCTADIGWITGHSYITYGPLANGATSVLVSDRSTQVRGCCHSNSGNGCSYGGIRCRAGCLPPGDSKALYSRWIMVFVCYVVVPVLQFEGLPTYPDVSRMWEVVDKYQVTKFYTAPTAIRMLMKYGNEPVQK